MNQAQPHIPGITSAVVIPSDAPWLPESLRHRTDDVVINFRFSEGERRIYKRKRKGMKPSEFAAAKLKFTSGPSVGQPMDFADTPYTAAILDASFFPSVQEITVVSGPQMLKTTLVQAALGYIAEYDPGPAMVAYPDKDTTTDNSRDRLQTIFTGSPAMAHHLTRYADDLTGKRIDLVSMPIYMAHAGSATSIANKSVRYLFNDEKAKFPASPNKDEAGSSDLTDQRTNSYRYNKKTWNLSTTKRESDLIWQDLTVRAEVIFKFHVPCPTCGTYQVMEFGDRDSPSGFKFPPEERNSERIKNHDLAWYQCACGAKWDSFAREQAVKRGEFRAEGDGRELFAYLRTYRPVHIGFHLPSWLSKFITLGKVVGAFLAGAKDKLKMRSFCNNHKAEPSFDRIADRVEDKILRLCDDRPEGMVPGGGVVAALTAGVDTQDIGCFVEIRAWGYGLDRESWLVRKCFVDSETALAKVLWEHEYKDAAGNIYPVIFALRDAMGHRADDAYEFCRQHRGQILPAKGERFKPQAFTYGNLEYFPTSGKPIPGGLKLVNISTKYFKDIISNKLDVAPSDPGAWHLHRAFEPQPKGVTVVNQVSVLDDYARHYCAETTNESGFWVPVKEGRPNHYWDCGVLALVAAEIVGGGIKYWPVPSAEAVAAEEDNYETASAL